MGLMEGICLVEGMGLVGGNRPHAVSRQQETGLMSTEMRLEKQPREKRPAGEMGLAQVSKIPGRRSLHSISALFSAPMGLMGFIEPARKRVIRQQKCASRKTPRRRNESYRRNEL
jgi:hypothetical protein